MSKNAIVVLSIDVGTSAAKAAAVDSSGAVLAIESEAYDTATPQPGFCEQSAEDWRTATVLAAKRVTEKYAISAISVSGQMQCLAIQGRSRTIIHSDARANQQAEAIEALEHQQIPAMNWKGGCSILPKAIWLKEKEGVQIDSTIMLGAHDVICSFLCGTTPVCDPVTASTTGLTNDKGEWAIDFVERHYPGLTKHLPRIMRSGDGPAGSLLEAVATAIGCKGDVPVFHAPGDVGTTTLGAGAEGLGSSYCYLGTSGWYATTASRLPEKDSGDAAGEGVFNLAHPVDSSLITRAAAVMTAGGNITWLSRCLHGTAKNTETECTAVDYTRIDALARQSPTGSNGVLYFPCIAGERSPFTDSKARACFIGIGLGTMAADLNRAVLEGICFAYRSLIELLDDPSATEGGIFFVGGGTRSALLMQIMADVINRPVLTAGDEAAVAARGAAIYAGLEMGWLGAGDKEKFLQVKQTFTPTSIEQERKVLDGLFRSFQSVYPAMKNTFSLMNDASV